MYEVTATPFLSEGFLALRRRQQRVLRIPAGHHQQLRALPVGSQEIPDYWPAAARTPETCLPTRPALRGGSGPKCQPTAAMH